MESIIKPVEFTKEMRKSYTILVPSMLPIHFKMISGLLNASGYHMEILRNTGQSVVETGLKYVHNDTCYPALLVIGQMIDALSSGVYDTHKVAMLITQTGGGCRASNYIHLLRKALAKAGYGYVPVISLNAGGLEKNAGFQLTLSLIRKLLVSLIYADMLMNLKNQVKPYEVIQGETDACVEVWQEAIVNQLIHYKGMNLRVMKRNFKHITKTFGQIAVHKHDKIKVGVVGEIYVKYASLGNNGLEDFLASQNCEYMVPGLMSFMMYSISAILQDIKLYGGSPAKYGVVTVVLGYLGKVEQAVIDAIKAEGKFVAPSSFEHLQKLASRVVGLGNKMGEGWLLVGEMMELCEQGYDNIVCAQPFGCLPNHIVGKGMLRSIKEHFPKANITAIDYDPGAARVNQENRIKLMLAMAKHKDIANEAVAMAKNSKNQKVSLKTASML